MLAVVVLNSFFDIDMQFFHKNSLYPFAAFRKTSLAFFNAFIASRAPAFLISANFVFLFIV